jgi:hypothetical protein
VERDGPLASEVAGRGALLVVRLYGGDGDPVFARVRTVRDLALADEVVHTTRDLAELESFVAVWLARAFTDLGELRHY